jgi:phage major head subunit gpT-like protein
MGTTLAKLQAVARGITQSFDNGVRGVSNLCETICTSVQSNSSDEEYGWIGDVPGMKEFLGERQFDQLRAFNWNIRNKTFEQSIGFERHAVDDDRYGYFANVAQAAGVQAARHPDEYFIENLVLNAESSVCYDGQYFYDTDHDVGDSGTQSNDLTYAAATGTSPTVAEFKGAFNQALIAMMKFKSDQGKYFMPRVMNQQMLSNFHVLVPLAMWEVAQQAFQQMLIAQNSVAVDNVLLAKPQVHPVLGMGGENAVNGSDAKFQLLYTGGMTKPFIYQKRSALKRQVKGANDIEDKLIKMMSEARYNFGYGLWQYAVLTTFT